MDIGIYLRKAVYGFGKNIKEHGKVHGRYTTFRGESKYQILI